MADVGPITKSLQGRFLGSLKNPNIDQNSILTRMLYGGAGLVDAYNKWDAPDPSTLAGMLQYGAMPAKAVVGLGTGMADILKGAMDDPNDAGKMFDLASMVGVGGGATSMMGGAPRGALGMFAGRGAKTADLGAMKRAEDMLAKGANRDDVWMETGWFKDVDGQMKFEIDDSGAALTDSATDAFHADMIPFPLSEYTSPLGDFMNHQGAYSAYPELKLAEVQRRGGDGGSYQHSPSPFVDRGYIEKIKLGVGEGENVKSVALHEGQHAIQGREGFAAGGSPEAMSVPRDAAKARINFLNSEASRLAKEMDEVSVGYGNPKSGKEKIYNQLRDEYDAAQSEKMRLWDESTADPYGQYRKLAGEAEARNVQTRMDFTPEQRRAQTPWSTLDVPEDSLIVRRR